MAYLNKHTNGTVSTDELHAYVDGLLSEKRTDKVASYLKTHPDAAALVADYRQINMMLHDTFDGIFNDPIPAAQIALAHKSRPARFTIPAAAAIAGLVIGMSSGWFSHGLVYNNDAALKQITQRSSAAYVVYSPDKEHPVEVAADRGVHLSAWLSGRMGMEFRIPKLGDLGFELIGGRLMIGETSPAALLMYENQDGRRVVLYIRNDLPTSDKTDMQYTRNGDTSVIAWADGKTGFGLAGGFSKQGLMPAANLIRAQFSS